MIKKLTSKGRLNQIDDNCIILILSFTGQTKELLRLQRVSKHFRKLVLSPYLHRALQFTHRNLQRFKGIIAKRSFQNNYLERQSFIRQLRVIQFRACPNIDQHFLMLLADYANPFVLQELYLDACDSLNDQALEDCFGKTLQESVVEAQNRFEMPALQLKVHRDRWNTHFRGTNLNEKFRDIIGRWFNESSAVKINNNRPIHLLISQLKIFMLQLQPHSSRGYRIGLYKDDDLWYEVFDQLIEPEFHRKLPFTNTKELQEKHLSLVIKTQTYLQNRPLPQKLSELDYGELMREDLSFVLPIQLVAQNLKKARQSQYERWFNESNIALFTSNLTEKQLQSLKQPPNTIWTDIEEMHERKVKFQSLSRNGLRGLKKLSMQECRNITDEGITKMTELHYLRELNMLGCIKLEDEGLRAIARQIPFLESLDISSTNVTS